MKNFMLALMLCLPGVALADLVVIAHPSADEISEDEISRVYMGRAGSLMPVNLPDGHPLRDHFEQELLGRSPAQMKAYWSRLVFTGKGRPPVEVSSSAEKIDFVASNPNSIGYIPAADVTDQVRVIATITQ